MNEKDKLELKMEIREAGLKKDLEMGLINQRQYDALLKRGLRPSYRAEKYFLNKELKGEEND